MTTVATFPMMTSSAVPKTKMQTTISLSSADVLNNFRVLLSQNIVPCDELFSKLVQENLLLPTMVLEIKALPTVEEKNSRLLDLLSVRGGNWLLRFSDILQLSGHALLADTIRDEISGSPVVIVDGKEIFQRFPKLQKFLQDVEKQELMKYLVNRVRDEALRQSWKRDVKAQDKQKALEAKHKQLEEALRHTEVLKDKENTIKRLHEEVERLESEINMKSSEFKNFSKNIEQQNNQNTKQLDTQMKFNMANDKQIRRLTDREIEGNKKLNDMTALMEDLLERHNAKRPTSSYSRKMTGKSRSSAADSDWNISPHDTAKWTLDKVIKMVDNLAKYKEKYEDLRQERVQVMKVIGVTADEVLQNDMVNVLATKMKATRDEIQNLQGKVNELMAKEMDKENHRGNETDHSANLTEIIETLQADLKLKDSVIKGLKVENQKMRTQLGELKVRFAQQQQQPDADQRLKRAPTPFHILAPATESDSQRQVANLDADSDTSSETNSVGFQAGGPGFKPPLHDNTNTQQGLHLPPLKKHADFKVNQSRSIGPSYGNFKKPVPTKTTHSMTTGATQISRSTNLSESVPNNMMYKTLLRKQQGMLQISTFNVNKPTVPFGLQKNNSRLDKSSEYRRNASFFR